MQGTLAPDPRRRVELHLDDCSECAQTLAELARLFGSASWGTAGSGSPHSATPPQHPHAGRPEGRGDEALVMVGRYRLGPRLGAGGMGVVFEAHDPELDRSVAIKLLHPGRHEDAELTRTRLLREARAMARLAHPNVVAVHDVGRVGEQVFVAMELVEGSTLSSWLKREHRSTAQILEIFAQAGRGLQAAHEVELVHRDFKPDNVLVGGDGRARVTDFGLAQPMLSWSDTEPMDVCPPGLDPLQVSTAVSTTYGTIVGTPAYMAPEQWKGQQVDARSDQFSFCVALYEALHSTRPFVGRDPMALSLNVLAGALTPPSRSVGRRIRAALVRGLSVDPELRYPSMAELLAALSPRRRTALRVGTMVGGIALGVAATAGAFAWSDQREDAPSPASPSPATEPDAPTPDEERSTAKSLPDATAPAPVDPAREACLERAARVGGAWTATRESSLRGHIRRMDDAEAVTARVMPVLQAWVDHHATQATALCDPDGLMHREARARCLAGRAARLDAWAQRSLEFEPFEVRGAIASSVHALPSVERCEQSSWLLAHPSPPSNEGLAPVALLTAELAAAEADVSLRRLTGSPATAERLITEATALGYAPLLAEAQLLAGRAAAERYDPDTAVEHLERAALTAQAAGHVEAQASAAITLVEQHGAGRLRPTQAQRWQRVAGSLADRTEDARLRAGVTLAQGRAQRASLEWVAARETLDDAVDRHKATYGPDHPRNAEARIAFARVLTAAGDTDAALHQAGRACEILRRSVGPEDLLLAAGLVALARAHLAADQLDEALAVIDEAGGIVWGSNSIRHDYDHGDVLVTRGDILAAKGDPEAALEAYQKAEIYHYVGPRKAMPSLHRGVMLVSLGRLDEGVASLQTALAELESHYAPDDPRLVDALRSLGHALREQGRLKAARPHLERALRIADASFGFGPFKARSLMDLARLEQQAGNEARALELYDDGHVPLLAAYDMDHPEVVAELLARADLAFSLGQKGYAGRLYRSTLRRFIEVYGEGSPAVARAQARQTDD